MEKTMIWYWVFMSFLGLFMLYLFFQWPQGYLWSMRRVYDHERVVRHLAGLLGVAPTPGTVLNMLHMLMEEIELKPVKGTHPFFKLPAVAQLHAEEKDEEFAFDAPARFRQTIGYFAEQALPQERGLQLFSFKDVTDVSEVQFFRRWEKKEPYDDFEERALVKYLRSTPRVVFWPRSPMQGEP